MKRGTLVWCSDVSGIGGQSLVTKHVVSLLPKNSNKLICYKRYFNIFDLFYYFYALAAFAYRLTINSRVVYLVNSRSMVGFIRDLPVYILVYVTRCKTVVHSHGSDLKILVSEYPILSSIARFFLSKHTIIVPSKHVRDELIALLPQISVIENFTDVEADDVQASSVFNKKIKEKIIIIWNSNIIYSKGFFHTSQYVEELLDAGYPVEFRVFGKPMACEYMSLTECELKFKRYLDQPWLDYKGQVSRAEIISALLESDVVALPSFYRSECQPLALIDAMVLGKFLIVSNTPAIKATCEDYPGAHFLSDSTLLTPHDFHDLYRAFIKDSEAAARRAFLRFSKQTFNEKIMDVIDVHK